MTKLAQRQAAVAGLGMRHLHKLAQRLSIAICLEAAHLPIPRQRLKQTQIPCRLRPTASPERPNVNQHCVFIISFAKFDATMSNCAPQR